MESNRLVMPEYDGRSLYNLSHTVIKTLELPTNKITLKEVPIDGKKLSLVVVDGFGYNVAESIGEVEGLYGLMTSVFPSITTTALSTIMTGLLPGEHGILGGTTYVKKLGSVIDNFRYASCYSGTKDSLKEISPMKDLYKTTDIVERATEINKKCAIISPEFTANSELSNITQSRGGDHFYFHSLWDAIYFYDKALKNGYDFVYLYIPFLDKLSHIYGPLSTQSKECARDILAKVSSVAKQYLNEYRTIVTSDHGHIQAKKSVYLSEDQSIKNEITIPPFGSTRSSFISGSSKLLEILNNKYPTMRIWDSTKQNLKTLLGSSDCMYLTSFDYIGVPMNEDSFFYEGTNDEGNTINFRGRHGGLLADEMLIPLIIYD